MPAKQRVLAVPLHDLYKNPQKFGTVIAAIPQLLSRLQVTLSGVTPAQPGYSVESPQTESRDPRQQQQPQQSLQCVGSQLQLAGPAQTGSECRWKPTVKAGMEACQMCVQTATHTSGIRSNVPTDECNDRRPAGSPAGLAVPEGWHAKRELGLHLPSS